MGETKFTVSVREKALGSVEIVLPQPVWAKWGHPRRVTLKESPAGFLIGPEAKS